MKAFLNDVINFILCCVFWMCFASILNMIYFKIKDKEYVFKKRPRCSMCNHEIDHLDVLPIIGYLRTNGKCRYCQQTYSKQHIVVESIGLLFGMICFAALKIYLI